MPDRLYDLIIPRLIRGRGLHSQDPGVDAPVYWSLKESTTSVLGTSSRRDLLPDYADHEGG